MLAVQTIPKSDIREDDKVFNTFPAQDGYMFSEAKYPAYVAAWGTGKSFSAIQRAIMLSEESPDNLGVIFRREFTDLRDSTLKDFELYTGIKVDSARSVTLANGSTILFRHLEEMHGTMQNMNLGWFWIEQAEELETDAQFFVLHGRLRRNVKRRSGFITANTNGNNWIRKLWKNSADPDYPLFEANSFDAAKYLPADTIADWRKLETKSPKLFQRFVMNSWEESDTSDIIVQPEWVRAAGERDLNVTPPFRRIASIDVSRYGDDKTVIYGIENFKTIGKEVWEKKSTMETVGRAVLFAKKHGINCIAVDEIGVGGGVADRLAELDFQVVYVNASEKATGSAFYNRRAEIYNNGANLLQEGMVQLDPADHDLNEQLSWAKYKTIKSNGVFQVEAKDDIKERYGKSPDEADAWLNGVWALPQVRAVVKRDRYSAPARQAAASGMGI